MANTGVRLMSRLFVVMYLSCVMGSDHEYILENRNGAPLTRTYVTVPVTSVVTLVCQDRSRTNRVTWYKTSRRSYAAYMSSVNGICNLNNDNYPSITPGHHECKGGNFSITFSRIRFADQGTWYCTNGGSSSNSVEISVVESPTPLPTTSTHRKPTLSMTFTHSRSIPPTVSTHAKPTLTTVSTHIKSTLTTVSAPLRKTTTAFLSANPSEAPGVGIREPEKHVSVTEENNIPLIAATGGGIAALVIIITIVIVLVSKRKHFEKSDATYDDANVEPPPPGNRSTEGGNRRQEASYATNYSIPPAVNQEYENMYGIIVRGDNRPQSEARADETGNRFV